MKRYVKQALWIGGGAYAAVILAVMALEPIQELRVPLAYYPDGTLKTELFAQRALVQPDATIVASGIVFRVFSTNGTVDMTITAEDAECQREQQAGWSEKAVSMRQGEMLLTGEGFKWNGAKGTLRILRRARVSFPSEMIRMERVSSDDKQNK